MRLLSSLYDERNEKYPIYHSGILTFIIITGIPLNLGVTKLPFLDVILLFLGGFFSLFMLARNDKVGKSFLSHLHMRTGQQNPIKIKQEIGIATTNNLQEKEPILDHGKIHDIQDPLYLLQNIVEKIIISHDDHMDLPTRVKLNEIHGRLEKITNKLCKL
ncbi:MAG TPA: hypothetical protein VGR54_07560 [Nitrosopumilaceae archaeon]|nr:hypothetical protein [Nitrosopumilaceae archaeon]